MNLPISLEFFPPKHIEDTASLLQVQRQLSVLEPDFCSVTYGAAGSSRERTIHFVEQLIQQQPDKLFYPHLITAGTNQKTLDNLLLHYQRLKIKGIVALRGDEPTVGKQSGVLPNALSLVHYLKEHCPDKAVYVAAYPEFHPLATSPQADITQLIAKADAGATAAITQFFYNTAAYLRLCDDLAKQSCDLPIIPGIMPITNARQLIRFADNCGADIPRWIRQHLLAYQDDKASLKAFGIDVVSQLCERLIAEKIPGIHFYTMNRTTPTLAIAKNIGLL